MNRQNIPAITAAQMREVDRTMIEDIGITLVQMMENAGRHLAALAREKLGGDDAANASSFWRGAATTAAGAWSPRGDWRIGARKLAWCLRHRRTNTATCPRINLRFCERWASKFYNP